MPLRLYLDKKTRFDMGVLRDWLKGTEYSVLMGTDDTEVSDVIFDSRKAEPETVFVCMKGSRIDSHDFISDVVKNGCRTFVVEKDLEELDIKASCELNIIRTDNARRTLAYLSAARFGYPAKGLTLIGITGTKGKTSTSYMFKKVFETAGRKVGVIGTNGCVIGEERFETLNTTPDSYELNSYFRKMADAGCDTIVMECSSQGFKMDRTAGLRFDYGVFLNISPDHIGPLEHKDFDEYMYCKSRLLTQCRVAIVNADDEHCEEILSLAGEFYERLIRTSVGNSMADLYAFDLEFLRSSEFTGTAFKTGGIIELTARLSIPGIFNVSNSLPVIAAAADAGIKNEDIVRALKDVHVDGRMEVVYKSDIFTVIVDYAHNGVSMENLMQTLRDYEHGRLVVVFGCGGNRSKERRIGMGEAAARSADFAVFTSDNSRNERPEDIMADVEEAYLKAGGDPSGYVKIKDRREAIRYAMENARKGDIIAVIGKGHEDYQEENGVRKHFLDKEEILKIRDELSL